MPSKIIPEYARVRELFDYKDGNLLWRCKPSNLSNSVVIGEIAGGIDKDGKRVVGFDNKKYYAHHLVWIWHGREITDKLITFRDGDTNNTNIENLVESTDSQVRAKAKARKDSSSGLKGVKKVFNGYQARMWINKQLKIFGTFPTPEEAYEAYIKGVEQYFNAEAV